MVVFPNCKINLGLNILKKRADGFHDLETVFFPIPWEDALEIVPSDDKTTIHVSGIATGPEKENLVLKAYYLLKNDYPEMPPVQIFLHKAIPPGAGLGGGSSDAAFALQSLSRKFNLSLTGQQLTEYALQLGSDCPFFLMNFPCLATGRGENLEKISLSLSGKKIVLINPGIHVSTREAFNEIQPAIPRESLAGIIRKPIVEWKNSLVNDFENTIFSRFPEIESIKKEFYRQGALFASMSGSGSTVYGIFEIDISLRYTQRPNWFFKEILLK
jgi:4-diphosphocytidyl-2-C-methyl-D-erythritol kinase